MYENQRDARADARFDSTEDMLQRLCERQGQEIARLRDENAQLRRANEIAGGELLAASGDRLNALRMLQQEVNRLKWHTLEVVNQRDICERTMHELHAALVAIQGPYPSDRQAERVEAAHAQLIILLAKIDAAKRAS